MQCSVAMQSLITQSAHAVLGQLGYVCVSGGLAYWAWRDKWSTSIYVKICLDHPIFCVLATLVTRARITGT